MAFKITKEEDKRLDELAAALDAAPVNAALEEYNAAVVAAKEKFEQVLSAYNEKRQEAYEYVEGLRDNFQSEFDDMSEAWQEGDRGQAAQELIDAFDGVLGTLEQELSPEFPDELEIEGDDLADTINQLPREADAKESNG